MHCPVKVRSRTCQVQNCPRSRSKRALPSPPGEPLRLPRARKGVCSFTRPFLRRSTTNFHPNHIERMTMRLRRNEFCPIHQSVSCCGRERVSKPRLIRPRRAADRRSASPAGYRELRSPAEMRKLLSRKIAEQDRKCAIWRTSNDLRCRSCSSMSLKVL